MQSPPGHDRNPVDRRPAALFRRPTCGACVGVVLGRVPEVGVLLTAPMLLLFGGALFVELKARKVSTGVLAFFPTAAMALVLMLR